MPSKKDGDKSQTYEEKELEILRQAVDVVENRKGVEVMRDPEVKKIISIVEKFIADKKLVCYGGTAINNILPEDAQFYNKDIELPDYDFYSDNALDHAKELADIYYKAGYEDVEAKSGVHHGTYKVFVNFTGIADITQMDPDLFKAISKDAIIKSEIRYAPPDFLRMAMYLELSRPDGDVSRWEKVQKRLTLLNTHYPLKGYQCDKIEYQRGFEGATDENTGEISASRTRSRSQSRSQSRSHVKSKSASKSRTQSVKKGGSIFKSKTSVKRNAISQIKRKHHTLAAYMQYLFNTVSKHEETIGDYTYSIEEDKVTHRYNLNVKYERLLQDDEFVIYSMSARDIRRRKDDGGDDEDSESDSESDKDEDEDDSEDSASKSASRSKSRSQSQSQSRSDAHYSVSTSNVSYSTNREKLLQQTDIYNIVRDVFIKNKAVFFGGYANILYSRYMPKHQRRIVNKIPDFDILSEDPRALCEEVVRELTSHKYPGVKYTKHKGVGEVISEHYDIRVGEEVVAFLYKPLACHSYNTIRIDGESQKTGGNTIRIATIDTMLSFYLAFIYADRVYYDINRILCMSQFLFDVQQHNRLKQTGLLRRFSINCYGKQPTLESMRFEKTKKYEELKGKRDTREYEEWFLRYIPLENSKGATKGTAKTSPGKAKTAKTAKTKTRKRKNTGTKDD
jgi:hypothetical protein